MWLYPDPDIGFKGCVSSVLSLAMSHYACGLSPSLGDGWPSGTMPDCYARGREFKSWSGQIKYYESDGQLWKL